MFKKQNPKDDINPGLVRISKRMDNGTRRTAGVRKSELEYYLSKGWSLDGSNKRKVSKSSDKVSD